MRLLRPARWLLALLACTSFAGTDPASAVEPAPQRVTIRQALADSNGDRVPDLEGQVIVVTGVATYEPHVLGQGASVAVIQQHQSGMWLFSADPGSLVGRFRRGDQVEAIGKLTRYHGRSEIEISSVRRLGAGEIPPPLAVKVSDILNDAHAAQLVAIEGTLKRVPSFFDQKPRLFVEDGTGVIAVLMTDSIGATLSFAENLLLTDQVTLTGIAGVDSLKPPTAGDYRLTLRDSSDVFPPPIPYRLVAGVSVGITLIVAFAALWQRRRAAEQRARDLGELSERLREAKETAEAALAKVKTLSGFLPICASCKRIRDDKGYWEQLESYLREHTEAEFSHSICPECYARLYPEFPDPPPPEAAE